MNERYKHYKSIKAKFEGLKYNEIPLEKLCGCFISDMVYNFFGKSFFYKLKTLIKYFLFIPNVKSKKCSKKALFGWSIDRLDYLNLSSAYKNALEWEFDDVCLGLSSKNWRIRFDVKAFIYAFKVTRGIRRKAKLQTFVAVYTSVSFVNYLESNLVTNNLKHYLSFNSSAQWESVFTVFLRNKGVATYSMQHGMYFGYHNENPYDVINYENITAEFLLGWGEFSKSQIEALMPEDSKYVEFGNPLYSEKNVTVINNPAVNDCNARGRYVLVILPRPLYRVQYLNLITLIQKSELSKFRFVIRKHPAINSLPINDKFSNVEMSNSSTIEAEFLDRRISTVIGFNSTSLFESKLYTDQVFQYVSGNDEFMNVGFPLFHDVKELGVILSRQNIASGEESSREYYFG